MRELSRRYAQALYEAAPEIESSLRETASFLRETPALWEALCSPAVDPAAKRRILGRVLSGEEVLSRFYGLLTEKGRMPLLPEIVDAYREVSLSARGAARCVFRYARPPEPAQLERLRPVLCRLHHKSDVVFDVQVDPALLGGFLLELDGYTYDKSVRGVLRGLKQRLEEVRTA